MHPEWRQWLLVRHSVSDPTDLTAYVVFAPHPWQASKNGGNEDDHHTM